jgi:hypothetical protein
MNIFYGSATPVEESKSLTRIDASHVTTEAKEIFGGFAFFRVGSWQDGFIPWFPTDGATWQSMCLQEFVCTVTLQGYTSSDRDWPKVKITAGVV